MANVVGYVRVSTDKRDQLNSLETQSQFFREFCERSGHSLQRLYSDEGITGTQTRKRTEFNRMMRDAESGAFEMVLVKDFSRFARNTVDLLQHTRRLKSLGIEVLFISYNYKVLGNSEFVLTMHGAIAQEESANMSTRVKFGKRLNAERGRVPNQVYGYDKIPGDYFNLRVNDREAQTVRRIFTLYTQHGLGAHAIAKELNHQGVRTKRGNEWSQNAISRVLKNPLYTGRVVNGKEEVADFLTGRRASRSESDWFVVDKPELAIVDEETFARAQSILSSRGGSLRLTRSRQSNKHLFSTLIKCSECGYSFRRLVTRYRNTYVRWVCSGRNAQGADFCRNRTTLDEGALCGALRNHFAAALEQAHIGAEDIHQLLVERYRNRGDTDGTRSGLERQRAKLLRTRAKVMEMYEDELIGRDEMRVRLGEINSGVTEAERALSLCEIGAEREAQLWRIVRRRFPTVRAALCLEELPGEQLARIIDRIGVDPGGAVDIHLRAQQPLLHHATLPVCDNGTQRRQ